MQHIFAVMDLLKVMNHDYRFDTTQYEDEEKEVPDTMEAWLTRRMDESFQEGRIKEAVSIYSEDKDATKESVKEKIIKRFTLTEEKAESYVAPAFI